jgi:uncharacterized protein
METILDNLRNPVLLFFILGLFIGAFNKQYRFPKPISFLLNCYILMSIGIAGGAALSDHGIGGQGVLAISVTLLVSGVIPCYVFFLTARRFGAANGAAVAAAYGAFSPTTFAIALHFLRAEGLSSPGFMTAALALGEPVAVITGLMLFSYFCGNREGEKTSFSVGKIFRKILTEGPVLLLLGSLVAGLITGHAGNQELAPFTEAMFIGMLCLFVFDKGLKIPEQIPSLLRYGILPVLLGILFALGGAAIGIGFSWILSLPLGEALLMTILCASASYTTVPATFVTILPEAKSGLYVTMALAITFPFNVTLGMPIYLEILKRILPA